MTTQLAGKIKQKQSGIFRLLILIFSGTGVLGALLLPLASRPASYQILLGSVATQDYQAPRNISYVSEVLTENKISSVKASVPNIYLPVDPAIARHQIDRLRKSLDFINLVRLDNITDSTLKI